MAEIPVSDTVLPVISEENVPPVVDNKAAVTPFIDIKSHWAEEFINKLFNLKIVQGKTSTTFEPESMLTRAEMVKIALLAFTDKYNDSTIPEDQMPNFSDMKGPHWANRFIAIAQKEGIIKGYADGTFRPDAFISRAEALKILTETSQKISKYAYKKAPFTDVIETAWYVKYINFAFEKGIVSGKSPTLFLPDNAVTRAEAAKITVKLMELQN